LRWSLRFYPTLTTIDVVRAAGAVGVTSLLASLWPALRASRLEPVRALRGV
jgi:ABC-type lipoprotein release transport system permease subunit